MADTYRYTVVDLGFSKGGFCSAEECKLTSARSLKQKKNNLKNKRNKTKVINFCNPLFSVTNLVFLSFSLKATAIEYLDVTVLLEGLDLTALLEYLNLTQRGFSRNPRNPTISATDTHIQVKIHIQLVAFVYGIYSSRTT